MSTCVRTREKSNRALQVPANSLITFHSFDNLSIFRCFVPVTYERPRFSFCEAGFFCGSVIIGFRPGKALL